MVGAEGSLDTAQLYGLAAYLRDPQISPHPADSQAAGAHLLPLQDTAPGQQLVAEPVLTNGQAPEGESRRGGPDGAQGPKDPSTLLRERGRQLRSCPHTPQKGHPNLQTPGPLRQIAPGSLQTLSSRADTQTGWPPRPFLPGLPVLSTLVPESDQLLPLQPLLGPGSALACHALPFKRCAPLILPGSSILGPSIEIRLSEHPTTHSQTHTSLPHPAQAQNSLPRFPRPWRENPGSPPAPARRAPALPHAAQSAATSG